MNDDALLIRAREIQAEQGGSLVDAMIAAEDETRPEAAELPSSFTVTIKVKPRLARWIIATFRETAEHTPEERLGAYLATVLMQDRVRSRRMSEDLDIGSEVALSRDNFNRKAPE